MFFESSNTRFHWILHANGRIRTQLQCHPKLYLLKKKRSLSSNLQSSTFLLSKHIVINKKVKLMSLIDYSLIMSAVRFSVISEIYVNNGCILLYAVVTHVLGVAYLALFFQRNCMMLQIVPLISKCTCKIIERDDVICFVDVTSNTVPAVLDWMHIGIPAGTLKFLNTFQGNPVSILHKSIASRYRLVRVADGPIMARFRFLKNASWEEVL